MPGTPEADYHLFISDLHLTAEHPDTIRGFRRFLDEHAGQAASLYILGDFFDVWIGDDAVSPLTDEIAGWLAETADRGTQLFLMHGNRDFLMGQDFASLCHARLIDEPFPLSLHDQRYLLMHGDVLCTDDQDYQAFRQMVRDPQWQQDFLARPLAERQAFAAEARQKSRTMSSNKPEDIMDVSPQAVMNVMAGHDCDCLIHGHTHRPAIHPVSLDGRDARRIVLGDWDGRAARFLRIDEQGEQLLNWPLPATHPPASP